ncbi:hypothetical protein GCS73_03385 [Legionella longbeachae]|uniref:Uncharacterized protein n=2 Tax=Legionella longbeachae TaxID=450 RepID=D3HPV7_LEGLN|nr:hypothetical protein B0B39_14315 [Legionella longbeachae]EEZ96076.1 hypothetical protein LLB_1262 [Legionella longbeachae D-4968]CBJ10921.1 hypothetical protein LLO_0587 [Legionella longbeachae NSW150]HBD7396161.1 hypothetical protein [Legionella pneumophila]QIN31382.1 hypothetical protein GCB94_04110 [Legionella longbeachae]
MITFLTETYACQTCFIPITNYFRAITRRWLTFSTHLARNQYISQYAPFIRTFSKYSAKKEVQENTKYPIKSSTTKHGDLGMVLTKQFAFTLASRKSNIQGTCMRSVHKAMGSPKDHFTYCSIPGDTDLLTTYGEMAKFSSNCNKACLFMQQRSIENLATTQKNRNVSHHIEPLRNFEPYKQAYLLFANLGQNIMVFEQLSAAYTKYASIVAKKIKTFCSK